MKEKEKYRRVGLSLSVYPQQLAAMAGVCRTPCNTTTNGGGGAGQRQSVSSRHRAKVCSVRRNTLLSLSLCSSSSSRRECRRRAAGSSGPLPTGTERGGRGGGDAGEKYNLADTPITYGGNLVEDFGPAGGERGIDGRIPLKNVNPFDDVAGEFLPGAKLEDKCATLLCMYIIGKNASSGELSSALPENTDEDQDFVHICIDGTHLTRLRIFVISGLAAAAAAALACAVTYMRVCFDIATSDTYT